MAARREGRCWAESGELIATVIDFTNMLCAAALVLIMCGGIQPSYQP
ncbi:hypothetical protein OSCI_1420011 [Kamptonema sp. PCC 6506]|nr:hypothetical protein OSCI_1420011 [Kamptonema sp. PCC 6506]